MIQSNLKKISDYETLGLFGFVLLAAVFQALEKKLLNKAVMAVSGFCGFCRSIWIRRIW